jgi:hypothetical protein
MFKSLIRPPPQVIRFNVGGSSIVYWRFFSRFDLAPWAFVLERAGTAQILLLEPELFTDSRLAIGSHEILVEVRDFDENEGDIITVSSDISKKSIDVWGIIAVVFFVVVVFFIIVGYVFWCYRCKTAPCQRRSPRG